MKNLCSKLKFWQQNDETRTRIETTRTKKPSILKFWKRNDAARIETWDAKTDAIEKELSKIVGFDDLKLQVDIWLKAMILDENRRALGIKLGPRRLPHMVFSGSPGTGKTTLVQTLGKLLHMMGMLGTDKVIEVRRADLVGGQRALRAKIREAEGGILLVDDTSSLLPIPEEALDPIKTVMDQRRVVVILAGYKASIEQLISSNEGLRRRFDIFFYIDDFTCEDLAKILHIKMSMSNVDENSAVYGYKLHASRTVELVAGMIRRETTEMQRKQVNGGLIDIMLLNAALNLNSRVGKGCKDVDSLFTITSDDLAAGLRWWLQREGLQWSLKGVGERKMAPVVLERGRREKKGFPDLAIGLRWRLKGGERKRASVVVERGRREKKSFGNLVAGLRWSLKGEGESKRASVVI